MTVRIRQVPGFKGYWCSEDGVIWHSFRPLNVYYTYKETPFYPPRMEDETVVKDSGCPYKMVYMKDSLQYVHRIIAKTWVDNPRPDLFKIVDHIDKNEINNSSSNLRWTSSRLNGANTDALNVHFVKKAHVKNNIWRTVNKWRARVQIDKQNHSLGMYKTFQEAFQVARTFREQNLERMYKTLIFDEKTRASSYLF